MPIGDRIGGFIRPGFNPLLAPGAPTIGTASPGGALAVSITFTAPSEGGGAITSYEAVATDTVTAASFVTTGTSSPITVTGLSAGQSYTVTVTAINAYGPSGMSAASNSSSEGVLAELWTWGYAAYGVLGNGTTTNISSPGTGGYRYYMEISIRELLRYGGDKIRWYCVVLGEGVAKDK